MSPTLNSLNQRKWRNRSLVIGILTISLLFLAFYFYKETRIPGAALTSHNYTDRPVGSYWVNDNWGGNGGVTCCWKISGETAKVAWILSMSKAQEDQGMKIERHEALLPMPKRKAEDDTLHVYFLPGNKIELMWSATTLDTKYPLEKSTNAQKTDGQGSHP
ncbi:DUF3304 domain-containing protein [Pseudomonas koreensis]|uniref:DUF3304 domain-containing protein n=1 Tax=Pseudomonas koreensis TaxID=198620 RepID=UPI003F8294DA